MTVLKRCFIRQLPAQDDHFWVVPRIVILYRFDCTYLIWAFSISTVWCFVTLLAGQWDHRVTFQDWLVSFYIWIKLPINFVILVFFIFDWLISLIVLYYIFLYLYFFIFSFSYRFNFIYIYLYLDVLWMWIYATKRSLNVGRP